ncbi:MAG: DUF4013 domain-containing protein [Candidatus Altiarchaeota archaeon]|nr:DUF4013 domain-containing protein [Candidatus Altiarchaeota archaeon]
MTVSETVKKPFLDLKKFVVGILLGGIPILDFFVLGFALEAAKHPKKDLPNFTPEQFILGLKAKVIGIFYSLIQIIFLVALVFSTGGLSVWQSAFENLAGSDNLGPLMVETFGLPIFIAFFTLSLMIIYLSTFAIYEVAKTNSFRNGFNIIQIIKEYFNTRYAKVWLLAFLLQFVVITILGLILTPVWWIPVLGVGIINYVSTLVFWTYLGEKLPMK